MQIKAGIRKELYMSIRTFKLAGIIIAVAALCILDPLIYKALFWAASFADKVNSNLSNQSELPASQSAELSNGATLSFSLDTQTEPVSTQSDFSSITQTLMNTECTELGVMMALTDIASTGLLVLLLLLMSTAGGELKKRAVIIPNTAGLTPFNYILPKFILYPAFIFVLTILGGFESYGVSSIIFGTKADPLAVLIGSLLIGLFMAFLVTVHLTLGICTARPGISTAILYILSSFLPLVLSGFNCNKFNPFALSGMMNGVLNASVSGAAVTDALSDTVNVVVSIAITLVLMVVLFFITLITLNARKINNSDNEIAL